MKMETKVTLYSNLFFSILIGLVLTVTGGLITGGINWSIFLPQLLAGIVVGL